MSDLIIRKSHPIIEAGYKLSLAEQRIILLSLARLDNRDELQRKVTLSAKEFANAFGVSEKIAYRDLLSASKKLYDGSIILKGEDETSEFRWIESRTRYHKGEGRISFEFSQRVMPYLFELDKQLGYTQYHLLSVSGFSGTYSIRLYELCKKLQGMKSKEVEIEEVRRMLMLGGKYKEFKVFNRSVLTPSIAEINEKSDLVVSLEFIKQGRSVKGLKFTISSKNPADNSVIEAECSHLTKDGLTKLPQRPQVKVGSSAEGEYFRECLEIRKADLDRFKKEGREIPEKLIEDLAKYYRKTGDIMGAEHYEKKLTQSRPEKAMPTKAKTPLGRFNELYALKDSEHTVETAKELLELAELDGVKKMDKHHAKETYKRVMQSKDACIEYYEEFEPSGEPSEPVEDNLSDDDVARFASMFEIKFKMMMAEIGKEREEWKKEREELIKQLSELKNKTA